ncbi:MAG: hypothetical protein M0Z84_16120 [Gammaproteobacteria bacterium]|nr:hypothetical protein [Gammaproteobacteria bacterium]
MKQPAQRPAHQPDASIFLLIAYPGGHAHQGLARFEPGMTCGVTGFV